MIAQPSLNPFPGLRPFDERDRAVFFGRSEVLEHMRERLSRERALTVIGLSGSGKSSLVRSGLLPLLQDGGPAARWRAAVMRPGSAPLEALVHSLGVVLDARSNDPAHEIMAAIRGATLRRGSLGLIDAVAQARLPSSDRVVIVVDQLEELFRFMFSGESGADDTRAFVQLLLEAVMQREQPIYVVLTIRSDFVGDCAVVPGLAHLVNRSPYLIPNLTRNGLREIIEGPVEAHGATIARRLVNRILLEVGEDPQHLPVMQHALMRTWEAWQREGGAGPIDFPAYERAGGLTEALSRHADSAYASLDDDGQRMAQAVFCGLTDYNEGRPIRRPARVRELAALCGMSSEAVVRVIDVFRAPDALFLMPPPGVALRDETVVDITHESLIRSWRRMREWIDAEARRASLYRRIVSAARHWRSGETSLWRNPELELGRRLLSDPVVNAEWARRHEEDYDLAVRFLEESQREEAAAQEDVHRRVALKRRMSWTLVALAFVAGTVVSALVAFFNR